ncbi:MAG: hypothetical protein A4E48_02110 [Methanosaeta sp. PtaU1.Bin060]|nr:MAG: hypothetical protein A4E48_02110 [Methanosaeta sp. PtaU1.Bin060]
MIPRPFDRHSMRFAGDFSESACSPFSLSSTLWRMGRPQTGMGTNRGGFLTKPISFFACSRSPSSTRLREWLTLVVVRRMAGVLNCSDTERASMSRSLASWLSAGSKRGTRAKRA